MFEVVFYKDKNGNEPVKEYIGKLEQKSLKSKDARIKYNKIDQYIEILCRFGTAAGEPYEKYLRDGIWELRPLRDRILFFAWHENTFVLLSCFRKSTQKTPKREINKAKKFIRWLTSSNTPTS